MGWTEKDESKKIKKFIVNGLLAPEDLTVNEIRLLKQYYPWTYDYVRRFLEGRHEKIQNGEWTEGHEPPDTDRRIKRYENGNSATDQWKKKK